MDKALAIQNQVIKILGTDEVYLVGGSVRDLVMGNTPKDYDFTTSMLPEDMVVKCKEAGRRVYTIGEKFGTIGFKVAVLPTDAPYSDYKDPKAVYEYVEVTTFRSEIYTNKSRKPEVQFVPSLDEDLARRDFTMNAMVLRGDGSIYDPYGGRLHIHAKKIQTVGMPKDRIQEDPLRMLRAARFAARYDFTLDPNFIGKARQQADRIYDVSVERWVQELDKLITSPHSYHGWEELEKMGLVDRILPEVRDANFHYGLPVDEAWKILLQNTGIIFKDSENGVKDITRLSKYLNTGICQRLKFSNDRTDLVLDKVKKVS